MVDATNGAERTLSALQGLSNNSLVERLRTLQKRGLEIINRSKRAFAGFKPAEIQFAVRQYISEAQTAEGITLSPVQRLYLILGEIEAACEAISFEPPKKAFKIPIGDLVQLSPADMGEYFGPMLTIVRLARVLENQHCITLTAKVANGDAASASGQGETIELLQIPERDSLIPFLTHLREMAQALSGKCRRVVSVDDIAIALGMWIENHPANIMGNVGNVSFETMIMDIII